MFSIGGVPVGYVMEEVDGARTRTAVFTRLTRLGKSIDSPQLPCALGDSAEGAATSWRRVVVLRP